MSIERIGNSPRRSARSRGRTFVAGVLAGAAITPALGIANSVGTRPTAPTRAGAVCPPPQPKDKDVAYLQSRIARGLSVPRDPRLIVDWRDSKGGGHETSTVLPYKSGYFREVQRGHSLGTIQVIRIGQASIAGVFHNAEWPGIPNSAKPTSDVGVEDVKTVGNQPEFTIKWNTGQTTHAAAGFTESISLPAAQAADVHQHLGVVATLQ